MNTSSERLSDPVRQKPLVTHQRRTAIWLIAFCLALLSLTVLLSSAAMLIDLGLSIRQKWARGMISLVVLALLIKT